MIEVNFLPHELRKKKKALPSVPAGVPLKIFSIALGILIGIHAILMLVSLGGKFYFARLTKKVSEKMPRSQEAANVTQEIRKLETEQTGIDKLFGNRLFFAQKLNIISDVIPAGIWLNRLIVTETLFSLEGTVVSLKGDEMNLISSFLDSLKTNNNFSSDFEELALKSIQRRSIKATEVVDFIIAGLIKE
jgi:hypothetical protein